MPPVELLFFLQKYQLCVCNDKSNFILRVYRITRERRKSSQQHRVTKSTGSRVIIKRLESEKHMKYQFTFSIIGCLKYAAGLQ